MAILISKKDLEKLYKENPNKLVCEKLKITNTTLTKYLRQYGIELKGSGNGKSDHRSKLIIS